MDLTSRESRVRIAATLLGITSYTGPNCIPGDRVRKTEAHLRGMPEAEREALRLRCVEIAEQIPGWLADHEAALQVADPLAHWRVARSVFQPRANAGRGDGTMVSGHDRGAITGPALEGGRVVAAEE